MWTSCYYPLRDLPKDGKVIVCDLSQKVPKEILATADELLVYAWVVSGQSYPIDASWHYKIFVEVGKKKLEAAFYLLAHTYPHQTLAYSINSDNVWLPMPFDRKTLKVERKGTGLGIGDPISDNFRGEVTIVGYRQFSQVG